MRGAIPLLALPSYFRQISKRGRVPALYGFQVQGLLKPRKPNNPPNMAKLKHVLNIHNNFLNEHDKNIVEDILIHTLLESKQLESVETFHYQINVSYEPTSKEIK